MKHRSGIAAVAGALCALAVAVPAAQADSIAYIKDGNVHLATPDGSRTFQVTDRGGYSDVSQADDGTMIALHGVRLHRLDRMGTIQADFDTPVSGTPGNPSGFTGPFNPAVSPDGTKVAYTYFWNSTTQDPSCFPPRCVIGIREGGTGYSHADRQTGWDEPGLGKHSGWLFPAWIDNDNTMLSWPTHAFNYDVITDQLSDDDKLVHGWFSDQADGNAAMGAGDITRDRRKLAFQTGQNNETLTLYHVPSFPTSYKDGSAPESTRPSICYRYSGPDGGSFSPPTFAPDGGRVAWSEGNGIHIADVPGFENGCTTEGASQSAPLVIAGGSEPDWGPADVPADRPKGPGPDVGPDDGADQAAGVVAKVRRAKLRTALRNGLKVRVTFPADGVVSATARSGSRKVASMRRRSVRAGAQTVTLKFTSKAKKALKRKRAIRMRVAVSYTPNGGAAQRMAVTARLKR